MLKLISLLVLVRFAVCLDFDGWLKIKMEHALNCGEEQFCHRGEISMKSIRSGISDIEQINLGKDHLLALKALADENGFYTVRTLVTSADNTETEFLSSVKAANFLENGLADIINAWVLPTGNVISVSFHSTNESLPLIKRGDEYLISSNFYLHHIEQAAIPDTASYIQKIEREREARDKGEVKDNRSFLAKYWMYIVPIAIFVMISGATNPEAAQASR